MTIIESQYKSIGAPFKFRIKDHVVMEMDANGPLYRRNGVVECVQVGGSLAGADLFSHAYTDTTAFSSTGTGAYSSYDSIPVMGGAIGYNHFYSYQSRLTYTGSGVLDALSSFLSEPTVSGPVTNVKSVHIRKPLGVGVVTNFYGLYIDDPAGRATNNHNIYAPGNAVSYLGGTLQTAGALRAPSLRLDTGFSTYGAVLTHDTDGNLLHNPNMTLVNGVLTMAFSTAKVLASATNLRLESTSGDVGVCTNVATPAGGSTAARLIFGSTSGFGIYFGSGVPTVSAGQGSLYMRSDGSSTSTRMYVNTNGATGWTAVTTAT